MKLIYIINIILFILMTLNQIIFEHIDDKYAYGKYGDFKVIMMTKNRYINTTKLCKEYGKEFFNWKQNKNNQEIINEVEIDIYSALGIPRAEENKSFIIINGGKNQIIKGTYVHELLIPHIASWISPIFAVKVSKIVNSFITNEYINEIKMKNNEIKDKNSKIDSLEEKLNTIITNNEELLKNNKEILKNNKELLKSNKSMEKSLNKANYKLDETLEKLDEVHEELENTNEELEDTNDKLDITDKTLKIVAKKLDIAVEDRVVKTKSKLKNESFIVMYNSSKSYKYQVIKSKNESLNSRIDKLKFKNYEIIEELSLNNVPNASILWCLIKEELKNDIDYCGSRLNLKNIDETQFKMKINEIYNKRKNVII